MPSHKFEPEPGLNHSPQKDSRFRPRDPARHAEPPEASIKPSAIKDRKHFLMDAEDTTIGMPINMFQERFLPMDNDCKKEFDATFTEQKITTIFERLKQGWSDCQSAPVHKERALTQAWATVDRDETLGPLCPGHFFHLSESKPEPGDPSKYKIDASFIAVADRPRVKPNVPNWLLQRMGGEFKSGGMDKEPFDDRPGCKIETDTDSRQKVRGQVMSYSGHVFAYQQRTAFFMLFVNGPHFRMMRWDRSGVIVSDATDYVHDSDHTRVLLELLFAFSRLSDTAQGRDPTAVLLTPDSCGWKRMDELAAPHPGDLDVNERIIPLDDEQVNNFINPHDHTRCDYLLSHCIIHEDPTQPCSCERGREHVPNQILSVWKTTRDLFRDTLASSDGPRYQILIGGRKFLVGVQSFKASGMVGRGTRGYPALDWESQEITFLKDAWRPHYADLQSEGSTLAKLNEMGVPFVPTLVCAEDVPGQETSTSEYSPDTGSKSVPGKATATGRKQGHGLRHMIHHRVVVKEVCLPSTMFSDARELFKMIHNCIRAHGEAYKKCNLIHRDISSGNILLSPCVQRVGNKWVVFRQGLLTDWELAKNAKLNALQPFRTGTWAFMSHHCLMWPESGVGIPDELESLVHVTVHHSVRYLHHSLGGPLGTHGFMEAYFDGYTQMDGKLKTPPSKSASVTDGFPKHCGRPIEFLYKRGEETFSHPINKVFKTLFEPISARYKAIDLAQAEIQHPDDPERGTITRLQVEDVYDNLSLMFGPLPQIEEDETWTTPVATTSEPEPRITRAQWEEKAKKIETHQWMAKVFQDAITDKSNWPGKDKVPDQLRGYVPLDGQSLVVKRASLVSGAQGSQTRVSGKRSRQSQVQEIAPDLDVREPKRVKGVEQEDEM